MRSALNLKRKRLEKHSQDRCTTLHACVLPRMRSALNLKRKHFDKHTHERHTARMRASVVFGLALVFCGASAAALARAYAGASAPLPPAASDSRLLDKQVALMMAARGAF